MTFRDVVIATLVGNSISAAVLAGIVQLVFQKGKNK